MKFRLTNIMDQFNKQPKKLGYNTPEAYERRFNEAKLQAALWFESEPASAMHCTARVSQYTGIYKKMAKLVVKSLHADHTIYIAGWNTKGRKGPLYKWNDDPSRTDRDVPQYEPMLVGFPSKGEEKCVALDSDSAINISSIEKKDTTATPIADRLQQDRDACIAEVIARWPRNYQTEVKITLLALLASSPNLIGTASTVETARHAILSAQSPKNGTWVNKSHATITRHLRALTASGLIRLVGTCRPLMCDTAVRVPLGASIKVYEADCGQILAWLMPAYLSSDEPQSSGGEHQHSQKITILAMLLSSRFYKPLPAEDGQPQSKLEDHSRPKRRFGLLQTATRTVVVERSTVVVKASWPWLATEANTVNESEDQHQPLDLDRAPDRATFRSLFRGRKPVPAKTNQNQNQEVG